MARGSSRSGGKLIRSTQKIPVSSTHIEKLEERRLLSGSITINAQGQVTVTGTTQADDITAVPDPNAAGNILFTVDTPGVGTVTESYALASITGVVVDTDPPGTNPIVNDNDYVNFSLVTFNPGVNVGVQAGHGNDTIIGAQSPNLIFGGGGNDSLVGGAGNDTISGQNGNDTILGAAGNDLLYGDSGNDLIRGGAGNDQIIGGVGQDTLYGMLGNDSIYGGKGADMIIVGSGNSFARGDQGNDTIIGGTGNCTLNGNQGNDFIAAHNDDFLTATGDTPMANTGSSLLFGDPGNDTLVSTGGTDTLSGGGGSDSDYFVVGPNASIADATANDTISTSEVAPTPVQTFNISLTIQIVNSPAVSTIQIPEGAGSVPGQTSIAQTIDSNGTIEFNSDSETPMTLGQFFNQWGVNFNQFAIGQYTSVGGVHNLGMTVNGSPNTQFDQLPVSNGMNIVITFTN